MQYCLRVSSSRGDVIGYTVPAGGMALGSINSHSVIVRAVRGNFLASALLNRSRNSWYSGGTADRSGSSWAVGVGTALALALDSSCLAGANDIVNSCTPGWLQRWAKAWGLTMDTAGALVITGIDFGRD